MADLTIKKSFTIPSADLKAHHAAALAEVERLAAQAACIAELEAEVARLREALGRIYNGTPQRFNVKTARGALYCTGAIARAALAAPDTGGADGE